MGGNPFQHHLAHKLDPRGVRRFRVAGKNAGNLALARQRHVQHKAVPRHARNFLQFLVQGVFGNRPLRAARLAHEARAVNHLNGFLRRQTRRDQLSPTGIAQHQVRLNEAKRDT
ncbi:MAG: hypothetical protein OHK0021_08970 [Bryobacter sp.]